MAKRDWIVPNVTTHNRHYDIESLINPVSEVFESIYRLQTFAEYDDVVNTLKKRLMAMFDEVPIKKCKKTLNGYNYFATGICQTINADNRVPKNREENQKIILLEPYEDTTIIKKRNPNPTKTVYSFGSLTDIPPIMKYQLINAIYPNKKNPLKFAFKSYKTLIEKVFELPNEEIKLIDRNIAGVEIEKLMTDTLYKIMPYRGANFSFLTEKGVEALVAYFKSIYNDVDSWDRNCKIERYVKNELRDEWVETDIVWKKDFVVENNGRTDYYFSFYNNNVTMETYQRVYKQSFIVGLPKLNQIANDYLHLKNVLQQLEIM
jgi:hypothetical protein